MELGTVGDQTRDSVPKRKLLTVYLIYYIIHEKPLTEKVL